MDSLNRRPFQRMPKTDSHAYKGCTVEELDELEREYGVTLPDDYRQFMLQMGVDAGWLFRGLDYHVNFLRDMQEGVRELLAVEGLTLPPGSFVVLSSQGVCFWLVSTNGVLIYKPGSKQVIKQFNSFTDLVIDATTNNGLPT